MKSTAHPWISFTKWWRHQMETFSALLAICARNSPVPGEFPAQRPVTPSFDVLSYLRLNKRLSKQSWGWWFETLSCPLWRHCNDARSSNGHYVGPFSYHIEYSKSMTNVEYIRRWPHIRHTISPLPGSHHIFQEIWRKIDRAKAWVRMTAVEPISTMTCDGRVRFDRRL